MKKLFEEWRKGKTDPCFELILAEKDGAWKFFLSRCGITVHQVDWDTIWNAKTLPELPFSEKLSRLLRAGAVGGYTCSDVFFTPHSRIGWCDIPFRWYVGAMGQVGLTRHNRMLEISHPARPPKGSAPNVQQVAMTNIEPVLRQDIQSHLPKSLD